ncbi:MAG: hypothetical protein ACI90V_010339, partial [Bacillariaceae sp.]
TTHVGRGLELPKTKYIYGHPLVYHFCDFECEINQDIIIKVQLYHLPKFCEEGFS